MYLNCFSLKKSEENLETDGRKPEIWKSIKVADEFDQEHLLALKDLVTLKSNESSQEIVDTCIVEEDVVKPSLLNLDADIGGKFFYFFLRILNVCRRNLFFRQTEVVPRNTASSVNSKNQKKLAKKRKLK